MPDINYTVGDIEARCANDNASGLKPQVYVTTEPEVQTIPAATEMTVSTAITMAAANPPSLPVAGAFKQWQLAKVLNKNTFVVEPQGDLDSASIKTTVELVIPKVTADRVWAARGGCSHILIVTDQNGNMRIVGEKSNGATPIYSEAINGDTNAIKVVFEWNSGHPPYFYTAAIPGA